MTKALIGVLALQGAFFKHQELLHSLGVRTQQVRTPEELRSCDALIIPGGESTTISKQITFAKLHEPIRDFATSHPIFGTCAGLILMAKYVHNHPIPTLSLLDIHVTRNAYGRQTESFTSELSFNTQQLHAVFIRAPQIIETNPSTQILATHNGFPVIIQEKQHLACTFHPELTKNPCVHQHFLTLL